MHAVVQYGTVHLMHAFVQYRASRRQLDVHRVAALEILEAGVNFEGSVELERGVPGPCHATTMPSPRHKLVTAALMIAACTVAAGSKLEVHICTRVRCTKSRAG